MVRQAEELHRLSVQQKWTEMAKHVNEEMVHAFAAVGTYADIARVIKKRFAGSTGSHSTCRYRAITIAAC